MHATLKKLQRYLGEEVPFRAYIILRPAIHDDLVPPSSRRNCRHSRTFHTSCRKMLSTRAENVSVPSCGEVVARLNEADRLMRLYMVRSRDSLVFASSIYCRPTNPCPPGEAIPVRHGSLLSGCRGIPGKPDIFLSARSNVVGRIIFEIADVDRSTLLTRL